MGFPCRLSNKTSVSQLSSSLTRIRLFDLLTLDDGEGVLCSPAPRYDETVEVVTETLFLILGYLERF